MRSRLLSTSNLSVRIPRTGETCIKNISFEIKQREALGLVGASGCGKTLTAYALMRLLPSHAVSGAIEFQGRNLQTLSEREMNSVRGKEIGLIFQEAAHALDPVFTVGSQMREVIERFHPKAKNHSEALALEYLDKVGISDPRQRLRQYPHQMSVGMRQRVLIAMVLSCAPTLIIADEPTSALDSSTQRQIVDLFAKIYEELGVSFLFISHDLSLVSQVCTRVLVMDQGSIVEQGNVAEIFRNPQHQVTRDLIHMSTHMRRPSASP